MSQLLSHLSQSHHTRLPLIAETDFGVRSPFSVGCHSAATAGKRSANDRPGFGIAFAAPLLGRPHSEQRTPQIPDLHFHPPQTSSPTNIVTGNDRRAFNQLDLARVCQLGGLVVPHPRRAVEQAAPFGQRRPVRDCAVLAAPRQNAGRTSTRCFRRASGLTATGDRAGRAAAA